MCTALSPPERRSRSVPLPRAERRTRSPRMESADAAVVDGALLASGGGVSPPSDAAMESAAAAVGGAVVASGGGLSPSNAADVGAVTSTSEKQLVV